MRCILSKQLQVRTTVLFQKKKHQNLLKKYLLNADKNFLIHSIIDKNILNFLIDLYLD